MVENKKRLKLIERKPEKSYSQLHLANKLPIFPEYNRSQITIFIILAICIVIVLFFIFTEKSDFISIFAKDSPSLNLEKCLQSSAKKGVDLLSMNGGSINSKNNYFYNGSNVAYICYTNQYYAPCVMQKPMLKEEIETELKNFIETDSLECLNSVKNNYESRGYAVSMKIPSVKVELIPNNVKITAELGFELSKENTEIYNQIRTVIGSDLYNFVMICVSIANWEARYGDSETMNYMYFHPELKVEKKPREDGTKIYILTNRNSLDKFMFATRSYVRPAGITGN